MPVGHQSTYPCKKVYEKAETGSIVYKVIREWRVIMKRDHTPRQEIECLT